MDGDSFDFKEIPDSKRPVYLEWLGRIGTAVDYELVCDNIDNFLSVWDIETLQLMLKTQLEHENYEAAEQITKYIKLKNGGAIDNT